jgi:uncharacterized membrane protein
MAYLPAPSTQSDLIDSNRPVPFYRRHLVPITIGALVVAFLAAPWSFEEKAHAVLHGICGQTPGHTLSFGGMQLPLDTRCVGIYLGLLTSVVTLLAAGRRRAAGLPSRGAGALLLLFLGAMALDGLNSLLTDLGRWHPYTPSNDLRLLTGWLTGVALGSVLVMVTGMTLWSQPNMKKRILPSWRWPVGLALPCAVVWLLLESGSSLVYYPVSLLLIAAAVLAFATLAACAIVMLRNQDNKYATFQQFAPVAVAGIFIALLVLFVLGGGRFWLESALGLPATS